MDFVSSLNLDFSNESSTNQLSTTGTSGSLPETSGPILSSEPTSSDITIDGDDDTIMKEDLVG